MQRLTHLGHRSHRTILSPHVLRPSQFGTNIWQSSCRLPPKYRTERLADDTGNRDTCANCLTDLFDDKRRLVRCRDHSCADMAHTER
jgi:hypothetical protein